MRINNITDLILLATNFLNALVPLLIAGGFLWFLWGLAQFMLQAGNHKAHTEGRDKMIWGIGILTVMVTVWSFVAIVKRTFF